MRIFREVVAGCLFAACLSACAAACAQASAAGQAQTPAAAPDTRPKLQVPAPDPTLDVLFFADGDRTSGELLRIENGDAVFRSDKSGDVTVALDHILDLRCLRLFAVLRKGVAVNARNAVVGRLELRDGKLVVTPDKGAAITLAASDVALAIEDKVFERELRRFVPLHEGISGSVSLGASLDRSTENGTAIETDVSLTRTVPGVDYLPRRRRTELAVRDSYKLVDQPSVNGEPAQSSETHTFHAEAEHNEYLHKRFYVLADYSFDRNYSQGLLAEELGGGGVGATVIKTRAQTLDLKTDVHRATQQFIQAQDNTTLVGQKLVLVYARDLPGNLKLQDTSDYLPSYNRPHDYSANTTAVVTVPIYRALGISFTATDNYLNNPVAGRKHNSFRFATSLTFSQ